MPTRQDQLHSYQYSLQRVVAALVTHDPDPHRSPLRRAGMTAVISLVIAALLVGGVAIYGLLTGNSTTNVRDEAAVFMEKDSGARYVYLASDQRLHPVLNYTSGLLIANSQAPNLKTVSRKKLSSVPLGDTLGIPEAPDTLPGRKDLVTGSWTVCSGPPRNATGTVSTRAESTLVIGAPISDGRVLGGKGMLITTQGPENRTFLLYANRRHEIPPAEVKAIEVALGWNAVQPRPVSTAFLNAVPVGPELKAPAVQNAGDASPFDGARNGDVFTDDNRSWRVALSDGAADVTELQARLLLARPSARQQTMDAPSLIALKESRLKLASDLPATVPELDQPADGVCMSLPVTKSNPVGLRVDPTIPEGLAIRDAASVPGGVQADRIHLPRGKGALVSAAASPTAPPGSGAVSIITDTATRYPVASRELLPRLGYGGITPQTVSAQLITLVPQGPALDAERARQPATRGTPTG